MEWITKHGLTGAQALIATYPTPRDLRIAALATALTELLPDDVQALPWNDEMTIGQAIRAEAFHTTAGAIATLHNLVSLAAQDSREWQAPDGTITRSS